ncbi:MAG: ubiquinone/menaquinone biosynthesis C-methylase UbiE [Gammaproteobacteria bacterium]|jgi:ubiquinone/menaquinone biosynthesis C-methylase UbiE
MDEPREKHDKWRDGRVAGEYDARRFQSPMGAAKHRRDEAILRSILGSIMGPQATGARVLDLPSGTGRLLSVLGENGRWAVGADRSLEMLLADPELEGGKGPPVSRLQADVRALPFVDDAFDVVVSMRFFFHLNSRSLRIAALGEMARVGRQQVVVQDRSGANFKQAGRALRHRLGLSKRWSPVLSPAERRREFEEAGLEWVGERHVSRLFSDKSLFLLRPR